MSSLDERNNKEKERKENNRDFKKKLFREPNMGFNKNNGDDEGGISRLMRTALVWMSIIAGVFLLYILVKGGNAQPEWQVTYSEYQQFLEAGQIESATVVKTQLNDFEFRGVLKNPVEIIRERSGERSVVKIKNFTTRLGVLDTQTEYLWQEQGITWTYEQGDSPWWTFLMSVLPWVLLIGIYIVIMRRMQNGGSKGIFSFGKSRARLIGDGKTHVTFDDVAGADEAKFELQEIIDFLRDPSKYERLGGKIPHGVLLLGPPGTGKTLLARAAAGEASVPFFSISGADFVEMFVGVGASRVRDLFEQAKKNSPCIVFIDEIDAVGRHRGAGLGGGHDEREQTLNQLLVEMDGFEKNSGIIVIAATNRPDVLDPALLRPGRFDRQITVDRPDINGREAILKVHSKKVPLAPDVNLSIIARGTPGMSGADLENLMNEASLLAARRNAIVVEMNDIEAARDKILMGVERKSMVISPKEKEVTAYHEMGHALAGKLLPYSDPVHKVTIIPRGRALGVTAYLPTEDSHTLSKEYIVTRIITLLAGRAAELLVFNQLTTGAGNDLERATMLARKMVCEWGMSDVLGPVYFANKDEEVFLAREMSHPRNHSEETARLIDDEIRRLISECMEKAMVLLRENIELLHTTSKVLVERETIDAEELDKLMRGEKLPPLVVPVKPTGDNAAAPTAPDVA